MKKELSIPLITLMLVTMACSFTVNLPGMPTDTEKTVEIKQELPTGNQTIAVELNIGAGQLNLVGGANDLINGTIQYNIPDWSPIIEYSDYHLKISQTETRITGLPSDKLINQWDLKLTDRIPLELSIQAGAYQGNLELGGLHLSSLKITDGASDTRVNFAASNPVRMEQFKYNSGASTVTLSGLSNANFDYMQFTSGAGTYTLDFGGELKQDSEVNIETGMSTLKIIIPQGTHAVIEVDGEMMDVNITGTWTAESNTYSTEGSGNTLYIHVNMNLGSLTLFQNLPD